MSWGTHMQTSLAMMLGQSATPWQASAIQHALCSMRDIHTHLSLVDCQLAPEVLWAGLDQTRSQMQGSGSQDQSR